MDVRLVLFKSNGQRKDIPITEPTTLIGRGEECGVHAPVPSVSRRHCELTLSVDSFSVRDLASANGTYVNNGRVSQATLKAGDRIAVGPIVFTVQIDGIPEEIQPVKTRGEKMAEAGKPASMEPATNDPLSMLAAAAGGSEVAPPAPEQAPEEQQADPISALEALAGEATKPRDQKSK